MGDWPRSQGKADRRRKRDMRTVSQMIALFCRENHAAGDRVYEAHCGEMLCASCAELDRAAVGSTLRCPMIARGEKESCDRCEIHCYREGERERIREVMRYSGPRMVLHHPVSAVRHLLGK